MTAVLPETDATGPTPVLGSRAKASQLTICQHDTCQGQGKEGQACQLDGKQFGVLQAGDQQERQGKQQCQQTLDRKEPQEVHVGMLAPVGP